MTTTEPTPDVDLRGFNPFDPQTLQCPFPHYAAMRAKDPVHEVGGHGFYLVTRYDLVLEVVRDPQTYSNQFGQTSMPLPDDVRQRMIEVVAEGYPRVPTMLTADPPDHTRYRRLVTKAFTPKVISSLEPTIRDDRDAPHRLVDRRGLDRVRVAVRRAAARRGHRQGAQRPGRAAGRLQEVVRRLDRRHRHRPRRRRTPGGRTGRQRLPALLRRPAGAAPARAARRPADRPAQRPRQRRRSGDHGHPHPGHAGDAEHPPAAARRRQRDDDQDADRDGPPAGRAPGPVAPGAGGSRPASTRSSRRPCACRRRRKGCSASPPRT